MILKEKLKAARSAMHFLERAILTMESGNGSADPDYDLWSAFESLKRIQDAEKDEPPTHTIEDVTPPNPDTGFSLFNDM